MGSRATLNDVALAAGVSSATVDRVLNSRLPVKEATALRVIEAAERLGHHGARLMRERLREHTALRSLGFCLQKRHASFYRLFADDLNAAVAAPGQPRAVSVIEYIDALDPAEIARRILDLGREVDALALVAIEHPHVNEAIRTLHAEGKPCWTLLSDLSAPERAGYVGVDGRKSGRTAAWTISRMAPVPGPVAVFVGSYRYLGQEVCEMSFRAYLREQAPAFRVLDTLVNLEDDQLAYETTLDLLRRQPDLVGIYAAGGGVAGIIRALRERRPPDPHIVTVCNELTPEHRAGLADGLVDLVLATPTRRIARTVVAAMHAAMDRRTAAHTTAHTLAAQMSMPAALHVVENL
ncbi:LacI family DNA-binding transcriptional regulator [Sphaerotilus mobilis]|uniref:LacI family transcriptional regulator n=1 Tax=Sphaerotilus mobilis TaxID=47994 RepID=A0A4Q7LFI0_9BURK|nr:LacI family DNA-binding transcriptional regulator [Sphaerotilus mobilis]RZS52914.1 LacI family transcriptional regulator [Sphaerotilus mobilis]